jgi:hypothetical protein
MLHGDIACGVLVNEWWSKPENRSDRYKEEKRKQKKLTESCSPYSLNAARARAHRMTMNELYTWEAPFPVYALGMLNFPSFSFRFGYMRVVLLPCTW